MAVPGVRPCDTLSIRLRVRGTPRGAEAPLLHRISGRFVGFSTIATGTPGRREGRTAAQLNHRNIAGIYGLGEHRQDHGDGIERAYPFLVPEYLNGRDLKTVLGQRPSGGLPIEDVLNYGAQACDGLAAVHDVGIVHRDIKPSREHAADSAVHPIRELAPASAF